ncbi:outer membrane channel lipoprotein [Desulfuromonas versatilis]|uniref:Outer membrane channel lipoprotein n=1 Tax=Desulfuromonas versatilis TaxID=2802975 RepID=A0ABM8HW75_9BACT|nr:MtrB/PioB family outer membrane beta-barrel protein [Desulfuromonas versatilis]BCR04969.1 outer membrane channel lipoprotein [Desulfuromonas versatilis]
MIFSGSEKIGLILLALTAALAFPPGASGQEESSLKKSLLEGSLEPGYGFVSTRGNPGRAAEYSLLHSSATLGLGFKALFPNHRLRLDGTFRNESDFQGEADIDYRGLVRLHASSEALFHNLDHFPAAPPERDDALKPATPATPWVRFSDRQPGDDYSVEVKQNRVALRTRLPSFPLHFNLGYWRLDRQGRVQLSYLEEGDAAGSGSCNQCHVQSRRKKLDQVTEEVTAGFDAHLGFIDLGFEQVIREFREREDAPQDSFGGLLSTLSPPTTFRNPGTYQHDFAPDSRLLTSTLRAHTSVSGGLVGAAAFTLGKRENRSDPADFGPVEAETEFRKAAGDLTLTPNEFWTFNFRYRMLDQDSSNSDRLSVAGLESEVEVRDNVDLTRGIYAAQASFRPTRKLTLKAEFERRELHRGNTGGPVEPQFSSPFAIDPVWELPEEENINRYRLSFYSRPINRTALKLNGWYQFQTSDDPAYATTPHRGHQVFASVAWSPSPVWGALANARLQKDRNNHSEINQFEEPSGQLTRFELDRRSDQQSLTAGLWANPVDTLGLSLNYGFFGKRVLQDLVYGSDPLNTSFLEQDARFSQSVHTATLAANWRVFEDLRLLGEARYSRSHSEFDPDFSSRDLTLFGFPDPVTVDSGELRELSEVDLRQLGFQAGMDWTAGKNWRWSLRYNFSDYDEVDHDKFDGTVHVYMVSLARSW